MLIEVDEDGVRWSFFTDKASSHITTHGISGSWTAQTAIWSFQLHLSHLENEHVLLPLSELQVRNDSFLSYWTYHIELHDYGLKLNKTMNF